MRSLLIGLTAVGFIVAFGAQALAWVIGWLPRSHISLLPLLILGLASRELSYPSTSIRIGDLPSRPPQKQLALQQPSKIVHWSERPNSNLEAEAFER